MKTIYFVRPDIKLKHLMFGIVFLFSLSVSAQSLNFTYIDGTSASFNVVDVQKITFTADVMNLHLLNGRVYTWNVSTINNYKYSNASLNIEDPIKINAWQVLVYPNPITSHFNIQFYLPKEDNIDLNLYDLQGKLILEKNLGKIGAEEFQVTINLENISSGTYICRIIGEQFSLTKKIIKQ